jgi:hypothetical protein
VETPVDLKKLRRDVHQALKAWHHLGEVSKDSLACLLLVQAQHAVASRPEEAVSRLSINQILLSAIDVLASQDEMAARILRLRFPGGRTLYMVANQLNISEFTVSRLQRVAIERLTSIIYQQELALRERKKREFTVNLPSATNNQLFGLIKAQQTILARLRETDGTWIIALTGLGGIGKTALAASITRELIMEMYFADVVWLDGTVLRRHDDSATPENTLGQIIANLARHFWGEEGMGTSSEQRFFQVWEQIKQRPFLIVIDNLECRIGDSLLMARLGDLANPSKFLITTRCWPLQGIIVFHHPVDELSFADSVSLMEYHAREIGIKALAEATEADYQAVWNVIGGHPLALKQVASLLDILPLPMILAGLSQGDMGQIEEMYHHIYWQTWQMLSANGRQLLQSMPQIARSGGTPEDLIRFSELGDSQLWSAVQELRNHSLLMITGDLQTRHYRLHQLTETFLGTGIIHLSEVSGQ